VFSSARFFLLWKKSRPGIIYKVTGYYKTGKISVSSELFDILSAVIIGKERVTAREKKKRFKRGPGMLRAFA
jgi:hypothetical protein